MNNFNKFTSNDMNEYLNINTTFDLKEMDHQEKSKKKSSSSEESKPKSLYKTELCRNWEETNHCRYGTKCQYAHGAADLRNVDRHPKYKTQKCRTFHQTGSCPYGSRCTFRHFNLPGDDELSFSDSTESSIQTPSVTPAVATCPFKHSNRMEEKVEEVKYPKSLSFNPSIEIFPQKLFQSSSWLYNHPSDLYEDDSVLPSNAESLLPHQLLSDLESPDQPRRCPLRNYVNLPTFSQSPHYLPSQDNCKSFFSPWLF